MSSPGYCVDLAERRPDAGLFSLGQTLPWFALHVRSRFEKMTSAALRRKGYEEFTPLYRCQRHWASHTREVDLPLFPGYIFCRFDPAHRLPILTTPGVVQVLGVGKVPCPVHEKDVAAVRTLVDSLLSVQPWPFLRAGQQVRIERGPLQGLDGFVTAQKGRYRLVVSVTLLQRSVAVEIDRDWIHPL